MVYLKEYKQSWFLNLLVIRNCGPNKDPLNWTSISFSKGAWHRTLGMWPLWSTQPCLRTQMVFSFSCLFIIIPLFFLSIIALKHLMSVTVTSFFFQVRTLKVGPITWSPVISSYCVEMVPVLKSPSLLSVTWLGCQLRPLWFAQILTFLLYMDYWTRPRY